MRVLLVAAVWGGGIASLVFTIYACIRSNRAIFEMVEVVNRHADPGAPKETTVGWHAVKWQRVTSRYRAIEPRAPLIWRYRLWLGLMVVGGLLAFVVLAGLTSA
jgi:hypothetical protein